MITKETIDRIMDAADIVEVIGEFVNLKKRGANYVGLSPFANEKSPSFTVSPVKQIFKDFSTGKGGSVVTFLMELEKYSYPEALKFLAAKYSIEVEESGPREQDGLKDDRESLFIVNEFARNYFAATLFEQQEGINVGQSYFKERGFREETMQKFQLGYCLDQWDAFTKAALQAGYQMEYLEQSGLTIKKEEGKAFDRYKGRVIFPIHNLTGRVIGFGGRVLKTDVKAAKYVNSPESLIYHKSETLYGIYFAKSKIRDEDNCFLAEGYTDVISLHQSGIENVVASSGTSLTTEQIRLISRFTKNITVLYDGDAAGIKASLRGIDMILEEGLNVKIVLFPDGNDPDSYVRSVGGTAFKEYVQQNQKDFILFKTSILLQDAQNDPLKRAEVIRDIVASIAKIPDSIKASVFISETSRLLQMDERVLNAELNKIKRKSLKSKDGKDEYVPELKEETDYEHIQESKSPENEETQELEIIRLMIHYGNELWEEEVTVNQFLVHVLQEQDEIKFDNDLYNAVFEEIKFKLKEGEPLTDRFFINHPNEKISQLTATLFSSKHSLSENWVKMHEIDVPEEKDLLNNAVLSAVYHIKMRKVMRLIRENQEKLRTATTDDEIIEIQTMHIQLNQVKQLISAELGAVILK
ncbi:DNA primase [Solitalea koreensis]|uniref:DNA primase n=1 Tax=Solitalea koreensis TaxID=543615 RepID=A0A521CLU5_9SPHI|nr:DNA primase [Solitalea koreensis]SMO59660.1 DNA primase [Solitalea koreensis]